MSKIFNEKNLKIAVIILVGLLVGLLIFKLGMFVGSQRGLFACGWAEHYRPNFFGPRPGMPKRFFEEFNERNLMRAHGTFGKIIQINSQDKNIVVKNEQEPEKIVIVKDDTIIEMGRRKIKFEDLKENEFIAVIGSPNNEGQIEAKIIRVLLSNFPSAHPIPFFGK